MGKVTATDGVNTRTFNCAQFALMDGVLPASWTVTENTCGIYVGQLRSPYASFGIELSGTSVPGSWYTYKGIVVANVVTVPTSEIILPSNPNNVFVIVRRQQYNPSFPGEIRDFTVNNTDNSIDFEPGLGLNGQTAYVRVFK